MLQVPQELARSASPATPDWEAAIESTHKLADLEPKTIGAGVAAKLREFADGVAPRC